MTLSLLTRALLQTVVLMATCLHGLSAGEPSMKPTLTGGTERHLKNIRQLTFGRQNAEAYFTFDGTKLIFQSTNNWMKDSFAATLKPAEEGLGCYQMYVMDLESGAIRLVSTGTGATTCGYFFPGDRRVLYSSTYAAGPNCPPKPKRDGAYRWALDDYDVYAVRDGVGALDYFKFNSTDLVVLDVNLSADDGWEVFHTMAEVNPFVPTIIITADITTVTTITIATGIAIGSITTVGPTGIAIATSSKT